MAKNGDFGILAIFGLKKEAKNDPAKAYSSRGRAKVAEPMVFKKLAGERRWNRF